MVGDEDSFLEELCRPDKRMAIEIEKARECIRRARYDSSSQLKYARIHVMNVIMLTIAQEYESRDTRIVYKTGPSSRIRRGSRAGLDIDECDRLNSIEKIWSGMQTLSELFADIGKAAPPKPEEEARSLRMQINALEKIRENRLGEAENLLDKASHLQPSVSNGCMYCSFLDALGRLDKEYLEEAKRQWDALITKTLYDPDLKLNFRQRVFSKNETAEFEKGTIENRLIHLKRNENIEDLEREYKVAHFLHDILGGKGIVPEPLKLAKVPDQFYFAQKIFPGRVLTEVLGVREENDKKVLRMMLRNLDLYQKTVAENHELSKKYGFEIPVIDYGAEFDRKFLQRLCNDKDGIDAARMAGNMAPVFDVLKSQPIRGVHGDLHATNMLLYMMDRMCIIDSEKLSLGAGITDWVNFLTFMKVTEKTDLDRSASMGHDVFAVPGMSTNEYFLVYHCARVLKSAHMAGTAYKYGGYTRDDPVSVMLAQNALTYIDEASRSLTVLKDIMPMRNAQKMQNLIEEFSKVRRLHTP